MRSSDKVPGNGRDARRRAGKRGNGEGSVYYDERMRLWRATVQIGGGKRRYISGQTRQLVAEKLTVALREAQEGLLAASQRLTLAQYLDQWMEQSAKPRLKATTYESYRHYIDKHIKPALGTRPLARLRAPEVQRTPAFFSPPHVDTVTSTCTRSCWPVDSAWAKRLRSAGETWTWTQDESVSSTRWSICDASHGD